MTIGKLKLNDRVAVEDLLRSYVYFNDTNDVAGIASVFTEDAVFQIGQRIYLKSRENIRAFAKELAAHADHGGRQHYFEPVQFERTVGGYAVRSYWISVQAITATDALRIRQMGVWDDLCVRIDGEWLIKRKFRDHWNDLTSPVRTLSDSLTVKAGS